MKIKLILCVTGAILLLQSFSFCQIPESKTALIPYSIPRDTFYLNRAGALRVLKIQADYSYCQQSNRLKDSIIVSQKLLYGISEQKSSILQSRVTDLSERTKKQRKVILRQRIAGVGIIAIIILSVLSG